MSAPLELEFAAAARLPSIGDNCAIAIRRLDAGTGVTRDGQRFVLSHTVLEGHRFAVAPIAAEAMLTSWGLPFGRALRPMLPGTYVCNATMLAALQERHVGFPTPTKPNFEDWFQPYTLDERAFQPAEQVALYAQPLTFTGFARAGGRGAGTRNHVVVLGTSSLTGSFARVLASKFRSAPDRFPNVDNVVAIAHTEGGEPGQPNNLELTLRTLAGFLVNPNVGAVLALDYGTEPVNNDTLRDWMRAHQYPLDSVPHRFLRLGGAADASLAAGAALVEELLATANSTARSPQPMRQLKIGMQCGGSDAFSGVSGNPVVGLITRELVRHGGAANLAETDELMGAEPYVLARVRDAATARKFLATLRTFEERLQWHGVSGQTNPSGGNIFRGLYNIAIKSIGAARKKDPAVRLDWVIDYAERMTEPGFYFMNSPGNDLESIAGQVAAGCNLIVFSTGNGSITNHPFVPTVKVMTNTPRFNLLHGDMDFNAGRHLDGEPLEALGAEAFEYTIEVASGRRSVGERAGHSQAQLWREWRQTSDRALPRLRQRTAPSGTPLQLKPAAPAQPGLFAELATLATGAPPKQGPARLIIPTSLCAGQVARMIADRLNASPAAGSNRYVALPHTEGCGVSGEAIEILEQIIAGYAVHPLANRTLLLEHGCEKTHNDAIRNFLSEHGIDFAQLGFASIQLDGGIERVAEKVAHWFATDTASPLPVRAAGAPTLGLTAHGDVTEQAATAFALLARAMVMAGGSVIVPENSPLLKVAAFRDALLDRPPAATLGYGAIVRQPGLHLMESSGAHLVEALTGMGACGAEILVVSAGEVPVQGHPLVPTLRIGSKPTGVQFDEVLNRTDATENARALAEICGRVRSGLATPRAWTEGNVDFQVSRGLLGVST